MNSIGSAGGQFLQLDGLAMRNEAQTLDFLSEIKAHGIRAVNLTFYGLREYHDRFAARQGDFEYLMTILRIALSIGLEVSVGVPLTRENAPQAEDLLQLIMASGADARFFIPHGEGRGVSLDPIRLRQRDLDGLSPQVRDRLSSRMYRTEAQWLREKNLPLPGKRMLTVSLTPENIRFFEDLPFEETIRHLEKLDEDYYNALPSAQELIRLYGNPDSDELYSFRDLCLHYGRRYLAEHPADVYDVTDERGCFSRRY